MQRAAWGAEGYVAQRRRAFQACVAKHGLDVAKRRVLRASEARRRTRLDHPTQGEDALRRALTQLGYRLLLPHTPFDYLAWRDGGGDGWEIDECTAVVEATVGHFIVDALLPIAGVVIEVDGGVQVLSAARDERRRHALEARGLTVLAITDTRDAPLTPGRITRRLEEALGIAGTAQQPSAVLS